MDRIFVSGIGVAAPGMLGRQALVDALPGSRRAGDALRLSDFSLEEYLENPRPFRRVAGVTRFALAAMALCVRDAGFSPGNVGGERTGIVVGITHGAAPYSVEFHRVLRLEGPLAASPLCFSESVPNAPAGNAAIAFEVRGPVYTLIGDESVGTQALDLAAALLRDGCVDRCLVAGTEEWSEVIAHAYAQIDRAIRRSRPAEHPPALSEGAAALVIEAEGALARRAATPLAAISGWSLGRRTGPLEDAIADVVSQACHQAGRAPAEFDHVLLPTGRHRGTARRGMGLIRGEAQGEPRWIDLAAAIGNPVGAGNLLQIGTSAALLSAGRVNGPGLALAVGASETVSAVVLSRAERP